ncbi:hypothetical protein BaRGS_00014331 [Batillaria attramentaria]|uniref:Uncharacterized protein n=1 Tax=Batillaria attramentaria TaxID=370345 RepID=A0ABD0L5Z9_9CAEN
MVAKDPRLALLAPVSEIGLLGISKDYGILRKRGLDFEEDFYGDGNFHLLLRCWDRISWHWPASYVEMSRTDLCCFLSNNDHGRSFRVDGWLLGEQNCVGLQQQCLQALIETVPETVLERLAQVLASSSGLGY